MRWLAQHERPGRRPGDLALLAFGAGLPVPEATVRAAFADAVAQATRIVNRLAPPTIDGSSTGAQGSVATPRGTLVPARIRHIDAALAKLCVNWAAPQLAALERGQDSPPANAGDWTAAAVSLFTDGPREANIGYAGLT